MFTRDLPSSLVIAVHRDKLQVYPCASSARSPTDDSCNKSTKLGSRIESKEWVLNTANRRQGIQARRGDGTFGEIVPGEAARTDSGFYVSRGKVATVEIGVEVKILAKAMIKQIDRVIGDLQKQVVHFRRGAGTPICVAIVGINHALHCTSYEGTNEPPFPFVWINYTLIEQNYGSALLRICREYDRRF